MQSIFEKKTQLIYLSLLVSLSLCAFFQCIAVAISNLFQVLASVFFLLYVLAQPRKVLEGIKKFKIFFYAYLLFILSFLPSVFVNPNLKESFGIWFSLIVLRPFLGFIVLLSVEKKDTYILIGSLLLSFLIDSVYAIIDGGRANYGYRLNGFYGHPMIYAGFACVSMPIFFLGLLLSSFSKLFKFSVLLIFLFCGYVVLLNGTRGAWLALLICFSLALLVYIRNISIPVLLAILGSLLLVFSLSTHNTISSRVSSLTDAGISTNSERIRLWKSSFAMFKDHPVTGVGMGVFKDAYPKKYIHKDSKEPNLTRAHSNFFQILGENGSTGLTGFFLFFGYLLVWSLIKFIKTREDTYFMAFLSTLGLMLQGLTEFNLAHSNVMKYFWLMFGSLMVSEPFWRIGNLSILSNRKSAP